MWIVVVNYLLDPLIMLTGGLVFVFHHLEVGYQYVVL